MRTIVAMTKPQWPISYEMSTGASSHVAKHGGHLYVWERTNRFHGFLAPLRTALAEPPGIQFLNPAMQFGEVRVHLSPVAATYLRLQRGANIRRVPLTSRFTFWSPYHATKTAVAAGATTGGPAPQRIVRV